MIPARGPQTKFLCRVCNAFFAMQPLQCNLCNAIFAMQPLQCNLCNAIFAMESLQCNLCNAIFAMQSLQCNLCNGDERTCQQVLRAKHLLTSAPNTTTIISEKLCLGSTRRYHFIFVLIWSFSVVGTWA